MKIAVVGATGLVGRKMLEVLAERDFPVSRLVPVGSSRSVGKAVDFNGESVKVVSMENALDSRPDIAIFSAGSGPSREWAPKFASAGTFVVDNSSAWRMDPGVPLVVPEVNAHALSPHKLIIANPNCSTIQMVVALKPLYDAWGIQRLVISTYQSITGTGKDAVVQYEGERDGKNPDKVYPHPIFENCLPHCDVFLENGYTREEMKLVHETRKILEDPKIPVTATAVRVPVLGGHSESVNVQLDKTADVASIRAALAQAEGVTVVDDPGANSYPMPLTSHEKDEVFVGRIRQDESMPNTFNMWIVSDNLRKGAATNAVQIAEVLVKEGYVQKNTVSTES